MARMRSLKPEFWHDQEITRLPRDARLLYMAMWNLADEHSRLQGDPRYLKGQAFPYDDDLTPADIGGLVAELVAAGRAQQYTVRGALYLVLPKLAKHQRLDSEKVPSRLPSLEESDPDPDPCEKNPDECEKNPDAILLGASSPVDAGGVGESEKNPDESGSRADKSALSMLHVACSREHVASGMEHVAGSMEHDSTTSDAPRPATTTAAGDSTAQTILAEWIDRNTKRPPGQVIGHVGKLVRQMLAEDIDADDIRRGLSAWMSKGLHPSTLPSIVNEVMNGAPDRGRQQSRRNTDDKVRDGFALAQRLAQDQDRPVAAGRKEIS